MKTSLLSAAVAALLLLPSATRADDESGDAAANEPAAASSGSFSFGRPKPADPAGSAATPAENGGESADEAEKDAVRNAIKQAVGENAANAEPFFAERLKDFPGNVVEAVMLAKEDGTPNIEIDADDGHVYANVGLRVNLANYAEWVRQLQEVLGAVCLEQERTNLKFDLSGGGKSAVSDPMKVVVPKKPAVPVVVATPAPEKARRSTWPTVVYWLDAQIWKAFGKALFAHYPVSGTIEVVLTDEDGEPVCSKVVGIEVDRNAGSPDSLAYYGYNAGSFVPLFAVKTGGPSNAAFVAPAFQLNFNSWRCRRLADLTAKFRIDIGEVPEEDMEDVKGFQVKVEFVKP